MTAGPARTCPAGHEPGPRKPRGACPGCRRDTVVARVAAADRSLTAGQVAAAVDAVAGHGAVLRSLTEALAAGEAADVLACGAPPAVGRLVTELIARGSTVFAAPACAACGCACAIDPVRAGRGLPAVPQPAARDRLHPVRRGPAGRRADQQRRAGLRAVPPPRTRPPPLRDLREDRPDRCPRPRQQPRRVRELLPAAHSRLHDLRAAPGMPLRGHPADLPDLLAAVYGRVRPLRAGPPAGCPLARGTGLRHLLYGRPAPARHLRRLRPATAAGLPARTGSRHLRRLRRTDHHPCVRAVRRRGQAIREGPMCPLQPTAANRRPDPGPGRAGHAGPGHRTGSRRRSHRGRADPVLGTELAADRGRRRDSRRRGGRPHSPHPQGAR